MDLGILREVSLNENMDDFSVEYSSIDKYDILNFPKYLMTMKNIKWSLVLVYFSFYYFFIKV